MHHVIDQGLDVLTLSPQKSLLLKLCNPPSKMLKEANEKKGRGILGTRSMRASRPQDLAPPFFLTGFFRVSLDGLSEKGTTHSPVKFKIGCFPEKGN